MTKKFGFTLTEVLITLSIVGVISAMTVPTLMNKYQKEAQAVQIRKASQEFANAIDMYITAEGKTTLAATGIFDDVDEFIEDNFKTTNTCNANDTSCFAASYRSIDNTKNSAVGCGGKSYTLANSASICVTAFKQNQSFVPGGPVLQLIGRPYLKVVMDTNGSEKPNIGGRDIFTFYINKKGEIQGNSPAPQPILCQTIANPDGTFTTKCPGCEQSPLGDGCYTTLEQNNWKMNY